jgi:hypothetical protein
MKKLKTPNLVTIVVLTTITIIFWVFFSVFRAFTQEPSPSLPPEILEPFNPDLDAETLSKIQGRTFFSEGQIPTITILTPTPTEVPSEELVSQTPTPTASPTATATISATPTATPSGEGAI